MVATPANGMNLNSTTSGIVNWDGNHVMSSTSLTQYSILSAASSNTINNISPGTSGFVLTSNGLSSQPTFQAASSAGAAPTGSLQYIATSGGSTFSGWLKCDGSVVSQATYPTLYTQIGLLGGQDSIWSVLNPETSYLKTNAPAPFVYGNGIYLYLNVNPPVMASTDGGATWNERNIGANSTLLSGTYGNSLYVVGGAAGVLYTSTDSITWSSRTSNTTTSILSMIYDGSQYKYVTALGQFGSSTDGTTWTNIQMSSITVQSLTYGSGLYLASEINNIFTSTDGVAWKTPVPTIPQTNYQAITYGTKFVAINSNASANCIYTSTDTKQWSLTYNNTVTAFGCIIYGGSLYVAGGGGGVLYTSTDATTWSSRTSGTSSSINAISYSGLTEAYVYVANGGRVASSTDATTWTGRTSGTTSTITSVVFGTVYVYAGNGGVVSASTDGITWSAKTSGTTSTINSLAYGNSTYVYVANGGVISSSTDGTTWNARTSNTTSSLTAVYFANSKFYAMGSNILLSSTDGTTWGFVPVNNYNTNGSLLNPRFAYGNSVYYINGNLTSATNNFAMTSTDGITWAEYNPLGLTWNSSNNSQVLFANSKYVFANGNYIANSTDAVTWSTTSFVTAPASGYNQFLAYGNGKFVSLFAPGTIYGNFLSSTTDFVTWNMEPIRLDSYYNNFYYGLGAIIYGDRFMVNSNSGFIITTNTNYSYDTSTAFILPKYETPLPYLTLDSQTKFPYSLYIKT